MVINPSKTKVVCILDTLEKQSARLPSHVGELTLSTPIAYKYLGVEFTEHLSLAKVIESAFIKANLVEHLFIRLIHIYVTH